MTTCVRSTGPTDRNFQASPRINFRLGSGADQVGSIALACMRGGNLPELATGARNQAFQAAKSLES